MLFFTITHNIHNYDLVSFMRLVLERRWRGTSSQQVTRGIVEMTPCDTYQVNIFSFEIENHPIHYVAQIYAHAENNAERVVLSYSWRNWVSYG